MAKIRAKYKIINAVINIIDGRASLEHEDVKKSLKPFFKTSVDYLSERGKVLKIAVKERKACRFFKKDRELIGARVKILLEAIVKN